MHGPPRTSASITWTAVYGGTHMRMTITPVVLCGFVLFLSSALGGDEEKIPLGRVPPAVTDAVKAKYPGAELTGAEKEADDGGTVYEVAFKHQGQKYEAELKPD